MKALINRIFTILVGVLLISEVLLIPSSVFADEVDLDYPHCSTYDIGCKSCHYIFGGSVFEWVTHEPQDLDDTPYNNLCWSCHNDIKAPYVKSHSSLTTSTRYGEWSIECRVCHNPHHQDQLRTYKEDSYVANETSTSITTTTLTATGAGWTEDQFQGYTLIPNLNELSYNYKITGNTGDTLTIDGYMNKRTEDFEQEDFSSFLWTTGGDADWTIRNSTRHSGEYAAVAPTSLADDQVSCLEARLKLTGAGDISFWYKVSSEADDDYLRFFIDEEEKGRWSGEIDWSEGNYPVTAAWHTFKWEYAKGAAGAAGDDTAWIDDINFPTQVTVTAGDAFAIIYGKLIRGTLTTWTYLPRGWVVNVDGKPIRCTDPNTTLHDSKISLPDPNIAGNVRNVKFFKDTDDNSYADGDSTYDGVCEVCHTQPTHFRNNGSGIDQLHGNIGGGQAGSNCVNCHPHGNGFAHGSGTGTGCGGSGCHGETGSHATHTTTTGNTKGPSSPMDCGGCHDTSNYPRFGAPGAAETLADTHVCDPCHSEGGSYNGINNSGDSIGAKDNWDTVYDPDNGNVLLPGKEKWCIGCHDSGISVIDGVSAPDTELYYTSGHGRTGAGKECLDCHVTTETHIDGEARTYAFNSSYYSPSQSGVKYASSYRLRYVNGKVPLMIPANYTITFSTNSQTMKDNAFRLCFDSGCHVNDFVKIFDNNADDGMINTNFKATLPRLPRNYSYGWVDEPGKNEHVAHLLDYKGPPYMDSDWDTSTIGTGGAIGSGRDSMTACSACHNVHGAAGSYGSTNEPMIRDGNLAGRPGGYGFTYVIEDPNTYPMVTSTGANQANSVGAIFRNSTANNMCGGTMCHGNPTPPSGSSYNAKDDNDRREPYLEYYRPWQLY